MRIYIIGSDGITLCRKAPATLDDGEIAVASNEELHAAPLSAKRWLALWNALPGVEKRKKVGDRDALIVFLQPGGTPPINRLKSLTPLAYLPSWRGLDRRRLGPRRAMILNAGSNR